MGPFLARYRLMSADSYSIFSHSQVVILFASMASVAAMYFRQRILNWVAAGLLLCSVAHFSASSDVKQLMMTLVFVCSGVFGPYIAILIYQMRANKSSGAGEAAPVPPS